MPRPPLRLSSLLLTLSLALGTALAADRSADPLRPVLDCLGTGPLRPAEVKRLPASVQRRTLLLPSQQLQLALADGYGMKLYTPAGKLVGELTVELAAAGRFDAGRAALGAQLQAFADHHPGGALPLQRSEHDGVELLAVRQDSLTAAGPMAYIGMYRAESGLLVSGQWLKPSPPARAFADLAGYESLRQQVEAHVMQCMRLAGR